MLITYVPDESVPSPRHGLNKAGLLRIVSQKLSQIADVAFKNAFAHARVGPD
jgi:hypothetical protein